MPGSFAQAIREAKNVISLQRERLAEDAAKIARLESELGRVAADRAASEVRAKSDAETIAELRSELRQEQARVQELDEACQRQRADLPDADDLTALSELVEVLSDWNAQAPAVTQEEEPAVSQPAQQRRRAAA